uniref:Uncharacterized protein n=1 Tax=Arundo donax TaxID=35708 RepID=A0A0A9DHI1_ARUDO
MSVLAYAESSSGSTLVAFPWYSLGVTLEQLATPMVCAPDSATRSVRLSPRLAKLCSRPLKPANGDGSAPVLDASDTLPSRRPVSTCHSDALNWYDTASRAASATMSAQETTPGHACSSCVLIASITS